jgi:hypothetical protein
VKTAKNAPVQLADDRLYTRQDVARILGCTARTVVNYANTKQLEETRIPSGRGVRALPRYTKAAILAFIAGGYTTGLR